MTGNSARIMREEEKEVKKMFKLLAKIIDFILFPFRKMKSWLKDKKENSKRVKATFVNFYNHLEMLKSLKIDFKGSYSDENEKFEVNITKINKESKEGTKNGK